MLKNFWLLVVMRFCITVFMVRLCFIALGIVPSFRHLLQALSCTQIHLSFEDVKLCFGQVREQSIIWHYPLAYSY